MLVSEMPDHILRGSAQSQLESLLKAWERRQIAQLIGGIHALTESLREIEDRVQQPAPPVRQLDHDAARRALQELVDEAQELADALRIYTE